AEDKGDSNTNSSSGGGSNGGLESLFLEDGKELQATNFSVGSSVKVMDGDGGCTDDYGESIPCDDEELILLAVGQYTLDDGRILVVEEEGVIAESADFPKEPENTPPPVTDAGSENSYQDGRELVLESNKQYEPLFWIFYPDVREELSTAYCFTQKNMSKPISFDRLINSRRFSATIYKEANVYEDRDIRDYIPNNSLMQLLESERIKEKIRNKEQDMWSY
ncbi:MAG: type IX secretion system ring subunit PorN/GldN, partial [Flavobacteriales bacterium]